jgi:hypothetical protein
MGSSFPFLLVALHGLHCKNSLQALLITPANNLSDDSFSRFVIIDSDIIGRYVCGTSIGIADTFMREYRRYFFGCIAIDYRR